jgi:hypothetical protein
MAFGEDGGRFLENPPFGCRTPDEGVLSYLCREKVRFDWGSS